jgi:hypothetical protein
MAFYGFLSEKLPQCLVLAGRLIHVMNGKSALLAVRELWRASPVLDVLLYCGLLMGEGISPIRNA